MFPMPDVQGSVIPALPDHWGVYWVYLCPVVMVSVQNIWSRDRDVLAGARYEDLVRVVLACGYRVCLARRVYTDYLDHKVTVIWIPFVTAVCEIAISRV